jgi:hypothetical protein
MNNNDFTKKNDKKYVCNLCDFYTNKKTDYNIHLETKKHKNRELIQNNNDSTKKNDTFDCECGKSYKHKPNLYAHKKKCKGINILSKKEEVDYKEIIKTLLEQNNSLQNTIKDLIPKIGNNNISNANISNANVNSNNKNLNICLFLNENCKDALSMDEFVKKIQISLTDLLFTKQKGIVNGISNIFIKNLNDLPHKKRPIWCSDKKRNKLFIKDKEWTEDVDNIKTKQAIKDVSAIQVKNINKYTEKYPDWKQNENKKEEYISIVKNTTSDITEKNEDIINKLVDNIYLNNESKKYIE